MTGRGEETKKEEKKGGNIATHPKQWLPEKHTVFAKGVANVPKISITKID